MDEKKYFERITEYKILAKHEVGQNFLVDSEAARKIVGLAKLNSDDRVLEIGSGAGSLSFFIAESGAKADLIDIDEGLVQKLVDDYRDAANIKPLLGNAMKWDYAPYTKIISNLPYYITSAILERVLLSAKDMRIGVFMVQKEVISRFKAPLGSEDYSPLVLLMNYRCEFKKGFNVPRTSFVPAPHIESSVFSLIVNGEADLEEANKLYALASALFIHKRKTILNNLTAHLKDQELAKTHLEKAGIPASKRPQDISLESYLALLRSFD